MGPVAVSVFLFIALKSIQIMTYEASNTTRFDSCLINLLVQWSCEVISHEIVRKEINFQVNFGHI